MVPVPFQHKGVTLCLRVEGGKLRCPFQGCSITMNRRDRATEHVRKVHNVDKDVALFEPGGKCGESNALPRLTSMRIERQRVDPLVSAGVPGFRKATGE